MMHESIHPLLNGRHKSVFGRLQYSVVMTCRWHDVVILAIFDFRLTLSMLGVLTFMMMLLEMSSFRLPDKNSIVLVNFVDVEWTATIMVRALRAQGLQESVKVSESCHESNENSETSLTVKHQL